MEGTNFVAFGMRVWSRFAVEGCRPVEFDTPEVKAFLAPYAEPATSPDRGAGALWWNTELDGLGYELRELPEGGYRCTYGDCAYYDISPDLGTVLCAPRDYNSPDWRRLFLDTVLWTVSLLRGHELLHAGALRRDGQTLAFVSETGGGKTSLVAELLGRGAALLADDVLALERAGRRFVGHPSPAVMNLPRGSVSRLEAAGLVSPLAELPDERWVAVHRSVDRPYPLDAVYLLRRRAGLRARVERIDAQSQDLIPHSLGLPGDEAHVQRQSDFYSALVDQVPVFALEADLGTSTAALADMVESALPDRSALAA